MSSESPTPPPYGAGAPTWIEQVVARLDRRLERMAGQLDALQTLPGRVNELERIADRFKGTVYAVAFLAAGGGAAAGTAIHSATSAANVPAATAPAVYVVPSPPPKPEEAPEPSRRESGPEGR